MRAICFLSLFGSATAALHPLVESLKMIEKTQAIQSEELPWSDEVQKALELCRSVSKGNSCAASQLSHSFAPMLATMGIAPEDPHASLRAKCRGFETKVRCATIASRVESTQPLATEDPKQKAADEIEISWKPDFEMIPMLSKELSHCRCVETQTRGVEDSAALASRLLWAQGMCNELWGFRCNAALGIPAVREKNILRVCSHGIIRAALKKTNSKMLPLI
uniref:Uncharacterized protein n=1 Tax=Chromera velia CCMP2878 TaxID=1169474 RepID=A0A0G4I9Y0_9ALVE|eukprot:Cvel_12307.t1-p1 / transcript=Cvel_12307.t1 / gene=Cvel_12307 / organism=Chromera_velia_CCMP2878 / gene_product=hypothetical protein / transcript_product=hypothetical protein / location=Cvel_scaffold799:39271-44624(+) / protein_length=220 / sequence_SO=supercontig / SO=protein_coding / is_pseudo=false